MGKVHACEMVQQLFLSNGPVRSTETLIMAHRSSSGGPQSFAQNGDSGALIYDAEGVGIATVWGAISSPAPLAFGVHEAVIVTPIMSIHEDIIATCAVKYGPNKFKITWPA